MHLIERLEKRARELDQMTRVGDYNQQAADDRELLLEAVEVLRALSEVEAFHLIRMGAGVQ